jgi:hypothetical protein
MSIQTQIAEKQHTSFSKSSISHDDNELYQKETYNYDFKSVCLKENVHLKREKNIDLYLLQFYLENKNRNLCDIINLNMYTLLYTLNKDNFEKIEIKKWLSDHEVEVLFLFKPFGKELGIKPKYMYVKSIEKIENGKKIYTGYDIEYPNLSEIAGYEKVNTAISNMVVNFESNNKVNINYIFKLDLSHSLPIYMENILGLIMKKMFIHLKKFIESVNF